MYARSVAGPDGQLKELTFGVSGKLFRNGLIMYDHQTGTEWSQPAGVAMRGPWQGVRLEMVPFVQTTWDAWRRQHPDTRALHKASPGYDAYESYYRSRDAGILGEKVRDSRLPTKQYVVGLKVGGAAKAYPFSVLSQQPVVNDSVGGRHVVVVFDPGTATGTVWDRQISDGGQQSILTFEAAGTGPAGAGQPLVRDRETGSIWDGVAGDAQQGPLAGRRLASIPTTTAFWFGWKDHFPKTLVYEAK